MMPCHWADQLIAEAIGRGWRPGGSVDTSSVPFSSEDYRLADLFKWPLHFGPKALPLLRWRNSIGSALHAVTAKPRDSAALRSVVSAHTGCSGEPLPPPRSCAVHCGSATSSSERQLKLAASTLASTIYGTRAKGAATSFRDAITIR